jgi:NDP-sugar pyrophosphorylase family protein
MKAVILAGGLGNRLKPFTEVIPKPLLPIGEKAVMEIQIDRLKAYGLDDIYLATNYKSDYIEHFFGDGGRYSVKLTISREDKPLGTAGPLLLLRDQLTEPFLVMNGDILTLANFADFYHFALSNDSLLNLAVKKEILPFAFGNIFYEGDYVTDIQEKPIFETNILAGIYIIKPKIFEIFPINEYFGMDVLIRKMLTLRLPVAKYNLKEYWLDIGRLNDYDQAQDIYNQHFK